jgi:hypothetical protein
LQFSGKKADEDHGAEFEALAALLGEDGGESLLVFSFQFQGQREASGGRRGSATVTDTPLQWKVKGVRALRVT